MGKTVSVIVYIKVSVLSLAFAYLCCVCVSFVVVSIVAVHCFCLFCLVFFFIVSGLLVLFGFAVVLVNLFHLRSAKYTEGLHTLKDLKSGEELRRP